MPQPQAAVPPSAPSGQSVPPSLYDPSLSHKPLRDWSMDSSQSAYARGQSADASHQHPEQPPKVPAFS